MQFGQGLPVCLAAFKILLTDEPLCAICMGLKQFSVNVPNLFSLTEQLPFTNPPRSVFSKIGCWNFFAISPVVKQMQHRLPHTQRKGQQITCRCNRAQEMQSASSACFSDSCVLNVYSVQLSAHLLSHHPCWVGVKTKWLGILLLKLYRI